MMILDTFWLARPNRERPCRDDIRPVRLATYADPLVERRSCIYTLRVYSYESQAREYVMRRWGRDRRSAAFTKIRHSRSRYMMANPEFERVVRPEPIIRADAVLNVAFERRDVAEMSRFAQDFGFIPCNAAGAIQYFRGHGDAPYLVSISPSIRDGFVGFSFAARAAQDLTKLAKATGA